MVISKTKIDAKPTEGDYKITKHFAWLPKKVDGFTVWLEYYKKVFEFRVRDRYTVIYGGGVVKFPSCGGWDLITEQRAK